MTRKNLLMMAVLVALAGAGAACAADQKTDAAAKGGERHAKIDANGDGFIDKAEAAKSPRLAEKFDTLDKNKDGKLSKDELPFGKGRDGRRREAHRFGPRGDGGGFGRLDADKDGRISKAEAANSPMAERFDAMDANKDGYLDKADREQRMKQHRDEWFAKADADKDGKLSRAEFDAAQPQRPPMQGPGAPPPPMHGPDAPPPPAKP